MKNIFFYCLCIISNYTYAQVGIGISDKELSSEELQIKGNLIITDKIGQSNKLPDLQEFKIVNGVRVESSYRVVAQDPNLKDNLKGQIKEMDRQQNVLPIIIQPYNINNINGDDLSDLNLNIPTDNYFIAITNFEAIDNKSQGFSNVTSKGKFEYYVYIGEDNFWHLTIRNPSVNPANMNSAFNYNFDIIIYPNRFFKNLGTKSYEMKGSQNGDAVTPIIN